MSKNYDLIDAMRDEYKLLVQMSKKEQKDGLWRPFYQAQAETIYRTIKRLEEGYDFGITDSDDGRYRIEGVKSNRKLVEQYPSVAAAQQAVIEAQKNLEMTEALVQKEED